MNKILLSATLGAALLLSPLYAACENCHVIVNKVRLSQRQISSLEKQLSMKLACGEVWYDSMTGAWGHSGGPTIGFIRPGLSSARLHRNASSGNTGVIVNNRELHWLDVAILTSQGIPVRKGRYWLNYFGQGGRVGRGVEFTLPKPRQIRRKPPSSRKSVFSSYDLTGVKVF
jgi:hypothetical protein